MIRMALRSIAILIAVAAVVDPAWSTSRPQRDRLIVVDLVDGTGETLLSSIRASLSNHEIESREGAQSELPCGPQDRCVIVADGSVGTQLPADLRRPVLIAVRPGGAANIAVRSVLASSAHASAAGMLRVQLQRVGDVPDTTIVVRDGAAVVGTVTHKWGADSAAAIDVPWWPIDAGARTLRVEAVAANGESATFDNVMDIGVSVETNPVRVLVFDARPSWNSTFVRRALEDDPRLAVEHRARIAPSLSAGTRSGVLDAQTLENTPVAIVGDPDALTPADVALFDRYVRVRGGSLILLPERRITGGAARLLDGQWTEHLLPSPEAVGALRASELLRATNLPLTTQVLAQSGGSSSIVALPRGHGRVIVSGAMDAWRFRDAAFDDFWRSTIVEAGEAGASLAIAFDSDLAPTGDRMPFTVHRRSFEARDALEITVTSQCGDGERSSVRVWPSGDVNAFNGELQLTDAACELRATVGDRSATAHVSSSVSPARGAEGTLAELERSVIAAGGAVSEAGDTASLARQLASNVTATSQVVSIRPMNSLWWMFPFAGCLAVEWWLRRRDGLR